MGCRNSNLAVVSNPSEAPENKDGSTTVIVANGAGGTAPFIMVTPGDLHRDLNILKTNGYTKLSADPVPPPALVAAAAEQEKPKEKRESVSLLRVKKGVVTSPYNHHRKPIPNVSIWKFLRGYIEKIVEKEGEDYEWLVRKSRVDGTTKTKIKYSQVEEKTRKFASGFHRLGIEAHDVVLFLTTNTSDVFILFLALWRLNVTVKVASPEDNSETVLRRMNESNVKYIVCDEGTSKMVQETQRKNTNNVQVLSIGSVDLLGATNVIEFDNDDGSAFPGDLQDFNLDVNNDVIFIPFTAGTCGASKGVLHTHKTLIAGLMQGSLIRNAKSRYIMMPLRIYHLSGVLWTLGSVIHGKTCVVLETVSTLGILEAIQEYGPGTFCGFPSFVVTFAQKLTENGNTCRSVTNILTSGETLNSVGIKTLRVAFPSLRHIDVSFCMAELLSVTSTIPFMETEHQNEPTAMGKENKAGLLCCYSSAKVVDPETGEILKEKENGELCFRTHSIMKGYVDKSETTSGTLVSGWVHTGDCGHYDENGIFYVTGRLSEVFKCDGVYISPYELEAILLEHDDVEACVVVGVPDDESGSVACAVVARKFGTNANAGDIKKFVDDKVSDPQKLRGGVIFMDDLPKTKAGKVSRPEVLRMVLNLNKMKSLRL